MTSRIVNACLALAFLAACFLAPQQASAQAPPKWLATYVEPWLKDCKDTPQTVRLHAYGALSGAVALDGDLRYEGGLEGGTDEDGDGDPIFETIQAAIDATDIGGVVHILVPGVYRENLTIVESITLRGSATGDVILTAPCSGSPGFGVDVDATDKLVHLENLTIQGFSVGVMIEGSDVFMTNCRVRHCETGVFGPNGGHRLDFIRSEVRDCVEDGIAGEASNWRIVDSTIASNRHGVHLNGVGGSLAVSVMRSNILSNSENGIRVAATSGGTHLTVDDSSVTNNGDNGISYDARYSGSVRVTNSLVEGNVADGISIVHSGGCVSTSLASTLSSIVANSRILGNGDDGIFVQGSGSGCNPGLFAVSRVGIYGNTIALNRGWGILKGSLGSVNCAMGLNQIAYNFGGNESGTVVCAGTGSTTNATP